MSPPNLIYEYSFKTFSICRGKAVLPVPPGRQYHQRLGEQRGPSNTWDSLWALDFGATGLLPATVSPAGGGGCRVLEHIVQLTDQSRGGTLCGGPWGWRFPSWPYEAPRRPRTVSKEWGGVSSFLSVITLGLLFVDFSTFSGLGGLLFHHQKAERIQK